MKQEDDILNELVSWGSPLANMSRIMPYAVPENYFADLCNNIEQNIKSEEISGIWERSTPYEVPTGYFEDFPGQMLSIAKEEDILLPFGKANMLTVPEAYFETLPQQMLNAARATEKGHKTKVISIGRKRLLLIRLAAAAILVTGIGIGSYTFIANNNRNPERVIARLPENVIQEYAQQNIDDLDVYTYVNSMLSSNNSDKYTQHLSTQEIEQYLEETGGQKNID